MILQSFPFVHPPFALAGVVAAIIPIVIHLINRRRHVRVPWAAMAFLRAASKRSARRMRFEHWLLLLTRAALIALVFLAAARPFFPFSALGALGRSRVHHIVLLDDSCSMRAANALDRPTRFDRAAEITDELIASFPRGDAVSLVTMSSPSRAVIGHAAFDRRRVRDELSALSVTYRATDVSGALREALAILDESEFPQGNARVYVISDLSAQDWDARGRGDVRSRATETNDDAGQVGGLARLLVERVGKDGLVFVRVGADVGNIGLTDLRVVRREMAAPTGDWPVRVETEVSNFTDRRASSVDLLVSLDDRIMRRLSSEPIGDGSVAASSFAVSTGGGRAVGQALKVRLDPPVEDALPEDNVRLVSVDSARRHSVLIVEEGRSAGSGGEWRGGRYLATALDPEITGGPASAFQVRTVGVREFTAEPLDDYRVVALCDVGRLSEADWGRLSALVGSGGGLLVFGGAQVDPDNYNRYGFADGAGVLPMRVSDVWKAPSASRAVRFATERFTHPVLADFVDHDDGGFFSARVEGHLRVEPDGSRADVIARYDHGDPAMIAGVYGAGRTLVFTTSGDMSWTTLPAKGDFVALMAQAVGYLASSTAVDRTHEIGDTLEESLSAAESARTDVVYSVLRPDGISAQVAPSVVGGRFQLRYGPLESPGVYRVTIGDREAVHVANISSRESDLRGLDEVALRETLECDFRYLDESAAIGRARSGVSVSEIGGVILFAALGLAVVESYMAMKFGAHR